MSDIIRNVSGEVVDSSSLAPNTHNPTPSNVPTLPAPKASIRIRPGVLEDYPFIDALQKQHKKAVGFMFEAAIKGHLSKGNVLVAEAVGDGCLVSGDRDKAKKSRHHPCAAVGSAPTPNTQDPTPVGYLLGTDRYLKRDELGIIYQLNVAPGSQRGLIGANLLKAKFEASAYGCRLYCCWCAQDLAANKFWEAMGFVPLAFRTGGGRGRTKKDGKFRGRMHIFWQKRIRPRKWDEQAGVWVEDDFPYWFPSQTGAGSIGEDRLVLPIPPGSHWSEAKPVVLPESPGSGEAALLLEARVSELEKAKKRRKSGEGELGDQIKAKPVQSVAVGGLHFGARKLSAAEAQAQRAAADAKRAADEAAKLEAELKEAKKAARKAKKKFDPAQEAFARELKDRWLEQVAAQPGLLSPAAARYDVSRRIEAGKMGVDQVGDVRLRLGDAA